MKPVNYFLLGEVFGLLERIELIDRIATGDYSENLNEESARLVFAL